MAKQKIESSGRGAKKKANTGKGTITISILANRLNALIKERQDAPADVATQIGVSYPHLMGILRGQKSLESAERRVLEGIARYMDIPVIQAYVWGGVLKAADFFTDEHEIESGLERAYRFFVDQDALAPFIPSREAWNNMPRDIKIFMAVLTEFYSGLKFFPELAVPGLQEEMSKRRKQSKIG